MTDHDAIRHHLLTTLGLTAPAPTMPGLAELRRTEQSPEFRRLRDNRMIQGAFRYGRLGAAGKPAYDRTTCAIRRLEDYRATGNTEHLLDVANLMECEWVEGTHPLKHFAPKDDSSHTPVARPEAPAKQAPTPERN